MPHHNDAEKLHNITERLALLPFLGVNMTDHIQVWIEHPNPEVSQLRYKLISSLQHKPAMRDKIRETLIEAAGALGISVVTPS